MHLWFADTCHDYDYDYGYGYGHGYGHGHGYGYDYDLLGYMWLVWVAIMQRSPVCEHTEFKLSRRGAHMKSHTVICATKITYQPCYIETSVVHTIL